MAGFDPDVFGGPAQATGFDADVFGSPVQAPKSTLAPAMAPTAPSDGRAAFDLRGEGYDRAMNYSPRDALGGQVRGAGSIGATLLAPIDAAARALNGGKPINVGGYDILGQDRRTGMDSGLQSLGVDTNSTQFQSNKLLAEIAGTSGVGGAVAKGASMIPGAARALPTLLPAIESGGMTANGATGLYGAANRVAGGAINGAATAGLVDPKDAGTGMMFGGVLPLATKAAGAVGDAIGGLFHSKPINPTLQQTARESVDAGYVIPPNMVKPSLSNQVIESISGKQATQQIASTKNNEVTEGLVRKALGIAPDVPLTQGTLEGLRKTAGKAYSEVSSISPQAAADLEALKQARNDAQGWFKAYNRSASPADLAQAKQYRAVSDQLEIALENHAAAANRPELIPALRDARKEIAKTYTVGRALNDASGTVDARVFGRMHEKGAPLSDGLDVAGKFASAFPTISKSTQQVGSPASHNLKSFGSLLTGAGGYAAMGPIGAGAAAIPFIAPPIARSLMFSGPSQRAMLASPQVRQGLLGDSIDALSPLAYRSGGLLATYGQ